MKKSKKLEFKECVSTTSFLKTVSAFVNDDGGEIIFWIDDNGFMKGISNPEDTCLNIENRINDNIIPQPEYCLKINKANNTVILTVNEVENKPYLFHSKAYKRNDTSTLEEKNE